MATSRLPIRDRDSGAHNMPQQRNVRSILTTMGGAMILSKRLGVNLWSITFSPTFIHQYHSHALI